MIEIRRFRKFEEIGPQSWSAALDLTEGNYIFQTYDYLNTWWNHFGKGRDNRELLILGIEEGGCLVAIAPLMALDVPFFKKKLIQFIGTDICDYMDFVISSENYEKYFLKFMEYLSQLNFLGIDLKYIPEGSKILDSLYGPGGHNGIFVKVCQDDACPYLSINGGFSKVYQGLRGKLKSEISKNERKIKEKGELVFKTFGQENSLEKILKDYFNLHIKRWKFYSKKYSQFQHQYWRNFIGDLCVLFLDKDNINLSYLELEGKMIACHFGFVYHKKLYYYLPAFDPDFVAYSPAKILIMKMLEDSCNHGLEEFDFLRGKEPYKTTWAESSRTVRNLFFYHQRAPLRYAGRIYTGIRNAYINGLKPKLKKIRPLMSLWYASKNS